LRGWIDALGREYSACIWFLFSIIVAFVVYYVANQSLINFVVMLCGVFTALIWYRRVTRNYREQIFMLIVQRISSLHEEPCLLFGRVRRRWLIALGIAIIFAVLVLQTVP